MGLGVREGSKLRNIVFVQPLSLKFSVLDSSSVQVLEAVERRRGQRIREVSIQYKLRLLRQIPAAGTYYTVSRSVSVIQEIKPNRVSSRPSILKSYIYSYLKQEKYYLI